MNCLNRALIFGSASLALLGAAPATQPSAEEIYQAQISMAEEQLKSTESLQRQAMDNVSVMREELRKATGRADVSPEGMRQAITRLQEQQEQLLLDEAGAEGRKAGLSEAVKRPSDEIQAKANTDAATDELKQVLTLREKELQRMQELGKAKAVAQKEVDEAQAAVADARLKLIEVRRQAVGTANAESLEIWNRELMTLSVAGLERRARLKFIQDRLERLSAALPKIDELERRIAEEQRAERMLQEAQSRYNTIRQRIYWQVPAGGSAP